MDHSPIRQTLCLYIHQFNDIHPFLDENECYDYVEMKDLVTNDKTSYCGNKLPADFTSKSNRVQISFVSDFSDAGEIKPTGFRFTYRTVTSKISI